MVDVARQLFAMNGMENTTMNDIALASKKGRRTLYTYFKSKEDIYYAVIESELERLSDKLDEVAARKIRPQEKVIELIYTHLNMIRETVVCKVFRDGKEDGEFDIENVELVAHITHYCIKGLEVPYIYGRIARGLSEEATKPQVAKFIYGALGHISTKG